MNVQLLDCNSYNQQATNWSNFQIAEDENIVHEITESQEQLCILFHIIQLHCIKISKTTQRL